MACVAKASVGAEKAGAALALPALHRCAGSAPRKHVPDGRKPSKWKCVVIWLVVGLASTSPKLPQAVNPADIGWACPGIMPTTLKVEPSLISKVTTLKCPDFASDGFVSMMTTF